MSTCTTSLRVLYGETYHVVNTVVMVYQLWFRSSVFYRKSDLLRVGEYRHKAKRTRGAQRVFRLQPKLRANWWNFYGGTVWERTEARIFRSTLTYLLVPFVWMLCVSQLLCTIPSLSCLKNKWFIWYSSQWLDCNNNQYNTIKSIQYCTRPRLIVILQAIGDRRIPKFISSGWDVFKSLILYLV